MSILSVICDRRVPGLSSTLSHHTHTHRQTDTLVLCFVSLEVLLCVTVRELDEGLEEPVSSIIWATPRLQSEVQELLVVSEQLSLKYGKEFAQSCRANALQVVNEKLVHKLSVQASIISLCFH